MANDTHVSELLAEVFRKGGMKKALRRAQSVLLWPQVAGGQLARFTRARNLVDGVLIVEVSDSETAMHLTLQRQRFLDVFHGKFGAREVRDIRFQTGRPVVPEEPEPTPSVNVEADPAELTDLYRALDELELPQELSEPAQRAARAMLQYRARRKAQGWTPCPTCAALTPRSGLCSTCTRYAAEPLVRAAAGRLAVSPSEGTPNLSDDQRAVSIALALQELSKTMENLLPQVLADPDVRPQLESAARCFLALELGKPQENLTDEDMTRLPQRIVRILGYWS